MAKWERCFAVFSLCFFFVCQVHSIDETHAVQKTTGYVKPTPGSAHQLTLTSYVTDAADLHFAVVATGHAPLDALAIKTAVLVGGDGVDSADQSPDQLADVLRADTIVVESAQKIEVNVTKLRANSSYDVYFVAEVPGSNGVFGNVIQVLNTRTNPAPPELHLVQISPVNATFDAAQIQFRVGSLGQVHFAVVATRQIAKLAAHKPLSGWEITRNSTRDGLLNTAVFLHLFDVVSSADEDENPLDHTFTGLIPSTDYDLFVVTESFGTSHVLGDVLHLPKSFRTHAMAPDIGRASCVASDGVSTQLTITLDLLEPLYDELAPDLSFADAFEVHYKAIKRSYSSATSAPSAADAKDGAMPEAFEGRMRLRDQEINEEGKQSYRQQSLVRIDARKLLFQGKLSNLVSGSVYDVSFVLETIGSHGVFGRARQVRNCATHFEAPLIAQASANPVNGTTNAIAIRVDLPRQATLHYFFCPKSSSHVLRNLMSLPPDEIFHGIESNNEIWYGVQAHPLPIANDQLEHTAGASASASASAFSTQITVAGLQDATFYSFLLLPETLNSNGVFGRLFHELVEARTNHNASEVVFLEAQPTFGTTTTISITAAMSKPQDRLHYCVKCVYSGGDNTHSHNCSKHQEPVCHELDRHGLAISNAHDQSDGLRNVSFEIGNLSEHSLLVVHLFAESQEPTQVVSKPTRRVVVRTHSAAPFVLQTDWKPVDATTDSVTLRTELSETGWLHYATVEAPEDAPKEDTGYRITVEEVVHERVPTHHHLPNAARPVIHTRGHFHVENTSMEFVLESLAPNTSYHVHLVSETSMDGHRSGVYGELRSLLIKTHALAPKILKATAVPLNATTTAVFCTINVTSPGRIWYKMSDVEFSDPALAKKPLEVHAKPHVVRGFVDVSVQDVSTEIDNNTNQSVPMQPLQFSRNFTIRHLHEATTYHLSLTSETFESNGVYGEFPPPVLVTTHVPAPQFVPGSFMVGAKPDSCSAIQLSFRLSSYGEVHYVLFYRGMLVDSPLLLSGNLTELQLFPNASNFPLDDLTPMLIKEAPFEQLGQGVLTNGTISVKREDVLKGDPTTKELKDLVPHGLYELCVVIETEASNGVFDWQNASAACHQVRTHADYSNQSILMDDVMVRPVPGTTDTVQVDLFMSKRRDLRMSSSDSLGLEGVNGRNGSGSVQYIAEQTGRVPWFLLVDGQQGRRDFFLNSFGDSYKRELSAFKTAQVGKAHVVAKGQLNALHGENDTFLEIRQRVSSLRPDTNYFLFVAYETWGSDGMFTVVNPFRNRSNDSRTENDAREVVTFESAPRLVQYDAKPTYGNTSRITVTFEVECRSCRSALVHLLVLPGQCIDETDPQRLPPLTVDSLREQEAIWSPEMAQSREEFDKCRLPLARKSVEFDMLDSFDRHQDKRKMEQDVEQNLTPNTTYLVLLATETSGSDGVLSERFEKVLVMTHTPAPAFEKLWLGPRNGSTTELLVEMQLDQPGEVHYMCGEAGHEDVFNVTSPYNVSNKQLPGNNAPNFHDYPHDAVRLRRTAKVEVAHLVHVEVLDYLHPGMAYDCFVVAETSADQAIYGEIKEFNNVATFGNAPILLAHAAWPTAASMTRLSLGFRMNSIGNLHVLVVQNAYWPQMERVAFESDKYGNRLAMDQHVVHQQSISINAEEMEHKTDSGWKEIELPVPVSDANYTVYLVTETANSEGVYGTVASHENLKAHGPPPVVREVFASAADARVDALNVTVRLSDVGHVHFFPWKHGASFDYATAMAAASSRGVITIKNSSLLAQSFMMDNLTEGTAYDVFLQTETLNSHGVRGSLRRFSLAARTHGLPPEVLDQMQCAATSACEPDHKLHHEAASAASIRIHGIRLASTSAPTSSASDKWDTESCASDRDARDQATCQVQDDQREETTLDVTPPETEHQHRDAPSSEQEDVQVLDDLQDLSLPLVPDHLKVEEVLEASQVEMVSV